MASVEASSSRPTPGGNKCPDGIANQNAGKKNARQIESWWRQLHLMRGPAWSWTNWPTVYVRRYFPVQRGIVFSQSELALRLRPVDADLSEFFRPSDQATLPPGLSSLFAAPVVKLSIAFDASSFARSAVAAVVCFCLAPTVSPSSTSRRMASFVSYIAAVASAITSSNGKR